MFNPFQQPKLIKTELFMSMPKKFRKKRRSAWSDPNRQGAEVECFLKARRSDRAGNLYFVTFRSAGIQDHAQEGVGTRLRVRRLAQRLKIHKDGTIYIADYKRGLLTLDEKRGRVESVLETQYSEGSRGSTICTSPPTATCTSQTRDKPASSTRPDTSIVSRRTAS